MFNKFMRGKDAKEPKDGKKKKEVKKYTPPEPLTKEELARLEQSRQGLFARPDGDSNGLWSLHRDSSQSSLTPSLSSSESQQSLNVTSTQPSVARKTSQGYVSKTAALERGRGSIGGSSFESGSSNNNSLSRPNRGILKGMSKYGPTIPNQGVSDDIDDQTTLYVNTNVNELIAAGEPAAIAAAAAAAKETHSNSPSPLMSGPISAKRTSTISDVSSTSHSSLTPSTSQSVTQTRGADSTSGPMLRMREKTFDDVDLVLPPLAPALPPASRAVTLQRSSKGDFGFSLRRSAVIDKHSIDSASKKNVIFAEPLAVGSGNTTGLLPGDRLVSVNGVNVEAASREDIIEHIRKSGSTLQLTVQPILELSELSNRKSSILSSSLAPSKTAPGDPVRKHGTLQGMRRHPIRVESDIAAERNWSSKNRVWLIHFKGFSAAVRSDETLEGSVQIMLDSGGNLEVEEEDVEKMNVPSMDRVENVALLPFLNESSVLHVIRQRYGSNLVHTFAGPHLVTINPMHSLSVYAEKVMQLFRGCKLEDLPPHIYATAQSAYRSLLRTRKDQSILLLGRSGSGKTSNARHLIHYLTAIAGSINNVLSVEKLNALSTLLEAFGNTRTTMNTNATRFSQLTALEFDYSGQVIGASLQVFLLEKSRICRRPEGEPTFHIFYHLLAGCDSELRVELQLQNLGDTNIFMTPPTKSEDKQRASTIWDRISKALETLGVSKDEARAIWGVLGAIYHLGSAGAVKGSGSAASGGTASVSANRPQFAKPVHAQKAATLLGTSIEELSRAIFAPQTHHASSNSLSPRSPSSLSRSLTPSHSPSGTLDRSSPSATGAGGNPNSTAAAIEMLEAFVISMYAEAFAALLSLINRNLSSSTAGKHRSMASISILDCPGLQTPKSSSSKSSKGGTFEDLCHNYLQERLLHVFHDQAFTIPLERYAQENISLSENSSAANGGNEDVGQMGNLGDLGGVGGVTTPLADIISVIDKPTQGRVSSGRSSMDFSTGADRVGLFWLLEEESIFPGSSDESFVDRLFVHHQSASIDVRNDTRESLLTRPSFDSPSSEAAVSEPTLHFTLHHLNATCPVTYNAKGWLKASRDQPTAKLAPVVLQESSREPVSALFNAVRGPLPPSTLQGSLAGLEASSTSTLRRVASVRRSFNATAASKRKSLCVQIKCQADSLVESLRRTNCHFVHCLLPKRDAGLCDMKSPALTNGDAASSPISSPTSPYAENCIDIPLLREQLRGFKLLEAVRLHRHGYPEHMPSSEFRRAFEILAPPEVRSVVAPLDETKAAKELVLHHLELDKNLCKFGLSRIFFRAGALADLEDKRDARVASTFTNFQACCRGFLVRRRLQKLQMQDLAIRCIQKNLRKYQAVRQWPWWGLYTKVIPLLNVHRTEEELTAANEEIEALKQKFGRVEKERNSLQQRNDFLETKLTEISTDLQEEQTTASHASELLDGEVAERLRLDKEMKEAAVKNANLQKKVDNLEMELYEARMINAQLDQTDDDEELDASFFKQKHDRVARELALCRKKLDEQREEAEEKCETIKKTMERRLNEANVEAEETQRQMTNWKRNGQRLNGQLQDLKLILEEHQTKNAELEKKQRRFDAEIARERQEAHEYKEEKDKLQRERDAVTAEKFALEADVSRLKGDLDLHTTQIERLEHELKDISTTTSGGDQEVLKLKRVKHELEMKLKEADEELDEQAGTIQQLEQAKLKLEMQNSKSSIQHQKDLDLKEEELEQSRFATQKRIKTLELQLEDEHEEKSQLMREKRNAEKQLRDMMERSPQRDKGAEKRLRTKLKRTSALLRDAQMTLEKSSAEGGSGAIKSLRNQLEDAEFGKQAATKAKSSIEMELSDVQAQLEQVLLTKQDAERKAMDAARQNHDLQSQLEEANDEILDVMKKYKAAVQQASVDHITVNDLLSQIADSDREKAAMSEQLASLQAKVAYLEDSCVEKAEMKRVEAKVRDLEGRLELETGQKNRLETQFNRLKETNDKLAVDIDDFKASAEREKDAARRAVKTAKDTQEEMSEIRRKDAEGSMKKTELESRAVAAEEALETAQSDLKLAFKRIQDLQSALEDQGDSESDLLTESDDDDDDDDSDDDFLRNRRPLNKSSGLGSAASSNRASLQSLEDASSSSASRNPARRMESYAGSTGANSVYDDDDDL